MRKKIQENKRSIQDKKKKQIDQHKNKEAK